MNINKSDSVYLLPTSITPSVHINPKVGERRVLIVFDNCHLWLWVSARSFHRSLSFLTCICSFIFSSSGFCSPGSQWWSRPEGWVLTLLFSCSPYWGSPLTIGSPGLSSQSLWTAAHRPGQLSTGSQWEASETVLGFSFLEPLFFIMWSWSGMSAAAAAFVSQPQVVAVTAGAIDRRFDGRNTEGWFLQSRMIMEQKDHLFLLKPEKTQFKLICYISFYL